MKLKEVIKLFALAVLLVGMATSCVKEGPMGPAGADGTDGSNGIDGTNGKDGNVTCLVCHSKTNMKKVEEEYEKSTHGLSPHAGTPTYIYAGAGASRKSCAPCHTNEGFVEVMFTKRDTIAEALLAPTRIGCETCHSGHVSFDFTTDGQDYALRSTGPVKLVTLATSSAPVDMSPTSNLCINCHQSREGATKDIDQYNSSKVLIDPAGDGKFTITSSRYGPHHGPQGNLLEGIDGYEIAGKVAYPGTKSHPHRKSTQGCTTCHMHEGDHTFEPSLASCKVCHSTATNFDVKGVQAEVEKLMAELHDLLVAKGTITSTGSTKSGTFSVDLVGVTYNYKMVEEDRSKGVHNPSYILAILKNSIEYLKK